MLFLCSKDGIWKFILNLGLEHTFSSQHLRLYLLHSSLYICMYIQWCHCSCYYKASFKQNHPYTVQEFSCLCVQVDPATLRLPVAHSTQALWVSFTHERCSHISCSPLDSMTSSLPSFVFSDIWNSEMRRKLVLGEDEGKERFSKYLFKKIK